MRVMLGIAAFELKTRLKLVSTYVYLLLFVAIAGLWMAAAGGAIEDAIVTFGSEKLLINGPYGLAQMLTLAGFMGVSVIAASTGRAVQQDFEHGTFHFFFTAPIRKRDYILGRFLGAYATLVLIYLGIAVGAAIGTHWPGVDPTRVGPESVQAYLRPYLLMLLPNMLWMGGVFFVIAALTRAIAPVYIAGVLVLIGYLLARALIGDMENKTTAALLDPVGGMALSVLTRYWSVSDRNTRPIPLEGVLLWNRVIWVGVGLVVFAVGYRLFRMDFGSVGSARRRGAPRGQTSAVEAAAAPAAAGTPAAMPASMPVPRIDRGAARWLGALPVLLKLYLLEIVRSPPFLVIVLAGAMFMIGSTSTIGALYGTNTWPVTYQVLEFTSGLFSMFVLVVTAIYAGELVWRERDARIDEIVDATPHPAWLIFLAKLEALFLVQAVLQLVVLVSGIGIQLWFHYTKFELGHALFALFVLQLPAFWVLGALALAIHVLVNQKYVGHFLVIVWFVVTQKLPSFGYENRLYLYGAVPDVTYSDMNGYGHFLPAVGWMQLYWSGWAVLLLMVAYLFWVRGKETDRRARERIARQRLGAHLLPIAVPMALVVAGSGAWVEYNTHVLNPFRTAYDRQRLQSQYEKNYKALEYAPQPHIVAVDVAVDIYPRTLRAHLVGHYALVNRAQVPIQDLYVVLPEIAQVEAIASDIPLRLADASPELSWRHYALQRPLQPGESIGFTFDIAYAVKGFENDGALDTVLGNGTFLNGAFGRGVARLPAFGYDASLELESDRDRKKFGLAPRERMHDLDDKRAQQFGEDWMDHYTATIGTDPDQTAFTSGDLVKTWKAQTAEGERAYFQYRMETRSIEFVPFLSGRYASRKDRWTRGTQNVDIEIDYHAGHEYDLDRMVAGVKDSLDYFSQHFSPYQHDLLRIIEFPRYERFAESFPNTVPFSEAIGFIARVNDDDPEDIDYPYFVTAHEVAHQWWGHQETPADVQGAEFITESLAEYSALMVLKHRYGDARMHRFLQYELDRYLLGRGQESKKEQPLMRADGPTYLHYQKGSLALYELQDMIGEEAVNQALSAFVRRWKFQGPPYPTSRDLLAEFDKVTPPDLHYVAVDLFETITLFELHATSASLRELPGGKFEVTLRAQAKKLRADGLGAQTEIPMDQVVDIGALDDAGLPLFLEKRPVRSGDNTFTFTLDRKPARAGIDPLNKLINRRPEDCTIAVKTGQP